VSYNIIHQPAYSDKVATKRRALIMVFHVTLEQAEDGWIVVECRALPGYVSQGNGKKETLDNIKKAITVWLWAEEQKAFSISLA
jgi:predicted RNase H-like HicB family nuclease